MEKRIIILVSLFLSIVGGVAGYFFTNSIAFGLCVANETITDASCINFYERLGDQLFYGFVALSLVFLILLILPQAFRAWKKFAIWFVPVAALTFATYSGDGFIDPPAEQVFQWINMLYIGLSLGIIAVATANTYLEKQGKKSLHVVWYWVAAIILGYLAVSSTRFFISFLPF